MVSSIEREFKTLLTQSQYQQLFEHFQLESQQAVVQTNHYYDTQDSQFKSLDAALRLRVFQDQTSEWTLKQQLNDIDSLELTQHNQEAIVSIPTNISPSLIHSQEIQNFINKNHIPWEDIRPTQRLKTTRYYIESEEGLYALDATEFNSVTDYELELEADNIDKGLSQFNTLLNQYGIEYQQADTKLARAFNYSTN